MLKDWEYHELLEAVKETYEDFLRKNIGYRYAVARTFYEFETVCNEGKTESLLVHIALGEIVLTHEKVFVGNIEAIKKELTSVNLSQLENELTSEEIEDLSKRITNVLKGLEFVHIDYNPRT